MPKKAPNKEAAYAYLNAMLDAKAMADLAAASFYAPANGVALLDADLKSRIDFSEAERTRLKFPDYGYVAKNTAEWQDGGTRMLRETEPLTARPLRGVPLHP
ncbi:MAG: hypothetical protein IPK59_23190 [Rhodospirillaceae bacterium]|nr:hypothetical protein [Rhodospirillaceae bacterium]